MAKFNIAKAKAAGMSDDEIWAFLLSRPDLSPKEEPKQDQKQEQPKQETKQEPIKVQEQQQKPTIIPQTQQPKSYIPPMNQLLGQPPAPTQQPPVPKQPTPAIRPEPTLAPQPTPALQAKTPDVVSPFDIPVEKKQDFNNYNPGVGYYKDLHKGEDYGAPENTPMKAPIGGQVIQVGYDPDYGNTVVIKGLNPQEYSQLGSEDFSNPTKQSAEDAVRLSHLAEPAPWKLGDYVATGSAGLKEGSTGHSSGPHLDLESFPVGSLDQKGTAGEWEGKRSFSDQYGKNIIDLIKDRPEVKAEGGGGPDIKGVLDAVPEQAKAQAAVNIPYIQKALKDEGIDDPDTMAYALATIDHETAGTFAPVREGFYADQPGQEGATGKAEALKRGYGGGENYYGRGYIQLTHKDNYDQIGKRIGVPDLADNPDKALDPQVAAKITAAFFKDRGVADYTKKGDFYNARQPINGLDQAEKIQGLAQKYRQKIK